MRWVIENVATVFRALNLSPLAFRPWTPGNQRNATSMAKKKQRSLGLSLTVIVWLALMAPARASEIDELKATIQTMQKSMEQMQTRITELERENHKQKKQAAASRVAPPPAAPVA